MAKLSIRLKKYITLFKSSLSQYLEYRGAMFSFIIVETLSIASGVFIWFAIYRDQSDVGGYDLQSLVTYFLLIPLVGGFTYVFVSSSLPKQIKDGRISDKLLKPYNILFSLFLRQVALKVINFISKLPMYIILLVVARVFFGFSFDGFSTSLAILMAVTAFVLNFLLDTCLSYLAFWIDDVWAFKHLKLVALLIFGGLMFPLDLLPSRLQVVFNLLPFKFVYYIPVATLQGVFSPAEVWVQYGQMIVWIVLLWLLSKILWHFGIRKYEAYGN